MSSLVTLVSNSNPYDQEVIMSLVAWYNVMAFLRSWVESAFELASLCVFFKYHSFFSSKNFFRTSGEPGGWLISTLHLRFSFFWGTSHFAVRLFDCLSCSQFRIKSQAWIFLRESFSFSQTGFRISKCKCLIQCLSFITKSQNVYYRIQNGNNIKYLFFLW